MHFLSVFVFGALLFLYVCLRIRTLLGSKVLRNISTGFFFLLAAGYPIAETLARRTGNGWVGALILLGYCALPLLLYLIMALILADLAIGSLRLTGAVSRETVQSRRFRRCHLLLCLTLPVLFVVYGAINHSVLRVKEYRFDILRRSSTAEELTVVFMADLHFMGRTSNRFLDKLVARVNAQKPDVILIGGDMLEGDRLGEDASRFERTFRRMISKYGIYAVPGNHEDFGPEGRGAFFERAGIRLLRDEVVPVDQAFALVGRKDLHSRNRKSVAELVMAAPAELPVILLSHRPTDFDEASRSKVAIQLSGHTHHGQLFPANFIRKLQYPLSWGHLEKGGTHFIVTSGVQVLGPPVRTVGASEILVLRVMLRAGL